MIYNDTFQKDEKQRVLLESSRVGLYIIILSISLISYVFSRQFINWSLLAPFYMLLLSGLSSHLIVIVFIEKIFKLPALLFVTFVIDSFLISGLIFYSGTQGSLFLFLHLVNIMVTGLVFQTQGALIIALLTSIQFTLLSLAGPEIKGLNYFFLLALNNISYFLIAGLSGYLSEQLFETQKALSKTGLSLKEIQELNQFVLSQIPSGLISFNANGEVYQHSAQALEILEVEKFENIFDILPEFVSVIQSQKLQESKMGRHLKNDLNQKAAQYSALKENAHSDEWPVKDEIKKTIGHEEKIIGFSLIQKINPLTQEPLWISIIEDLTKIKKLEFDLRQSEKMAAIGGLAAGIAHEIRNPLAGISGSIELLSQTTQGEDDLKLMKIVLREIDRLNNLITEFLDYARPQSAPEDKMNLSQFILEVVDSLKLHANLRKDVKVNTQIAEGLIILGNKDKLKQAFLNILINSYQAMQDVQTAVLSITANYDENKNIRVEIKDSGCGMKPETLKRMFEPFHTTKPKGTGLGLAVTHRILENHHVHLQVRSEAGLGTEFILVFPCVKSAIIQE